MERTPVNSSVIAAISYDPSTNTLEIEFRTGRTYRFFMVPQTEYAALLQSDSIGRYFNQKIRNRYPTEEIEGAHP